MLLTFPIYTEYFRLMKHCTICKKEMPISKHKFCSKKCQKESWRKNCVLCNASFIPSEQRVIFCSRNCGAAWKWEQPDIRARMIRNVDIVQRGKAISAGIRKNASEMKRRQANARRYQRIGKQAWKPYTLKVKT